MNPVNPVNFVTVNAAITVNLVTVNPSITVTLVTVNPAITVTLVTVNPAITVTLVTVNPAITVTLVTVNPAITVTLVTVNPAITVTLVTVNSAITDELLLLLLLLLLSFVPRLLARGCCSDGVQWEKMSSFLPDAKSSCPYWFPLGMISPVTDYNTPCILLSQNRLQYTLYPTVPEQTTIHPVSYSARSGYSAPCQCYFPRGRDLLVKPALVVAGCTVALAPSFPCSAIACAQSVEKLSMRVTTGHTCGSILYETSVKCTKPVNPVNFVTVNPALTVTLVTVNPAITVTLVTVNPAITVTLVTVNPAITVTLVTVNPAITVTPKTQVTS
ncbi:hypothetical protein EGW08_006823 [Elysia chlorotica]|uniref:Uncharacterized protein n=1 Tax=Elysia chlorotica TaxID=188477 RepID=A0A433TV60_ELYCH|nr:hypothetical protein EGW08_006823 [Elysia chlorotica]